MSAGYQVGDIVTMPARLSALRLFWRWLQSLFGELPPKPMAHYRITAVSGDLAEYDHRNPTAVE